MGLRTFGFIVAIASITIDLARAATTPQGAVQDETQKRSFLDSLGVTYFTFFNGPGVHPDFLGVPPNSIGTPDHRGINTFNLLSLRYKVSQSLAIDLQSRFRIIFNNQTQSAGFSHFQWESPRIGISGRLLGGETWSLTGALNTDFPYVFPAPLSGYVAQARTTILSPGMFANFSWKPKNSRFSVFSVLAPRWFIYQRTDAEMRERLDTGFSAALKPELILQLLPTLNYALNDTTSVTLGTNISYIKQVGSSWNPFKAKLGANDASDAWLIEPIPVSLGMTFQIHQALRIFPYIETFPIAAQRLDARTGNTADLLTVTRLGMWISGTLL